MTLPESMTRKKRETASLVPYRYMDGALVFYLQKRSLEAERSPGTFGMFGGGIEEGEDPVAGLMREIREELDYTPSRHRYFSRYETAESVIYVFIEEVGTGFESSVRVGEGEYGVFLTLHDTQTRVDMGRTTRLVTYQVARALGR